MPEYSEEDSGEMGRVPEIDDVNLDDKSVLRVDSELNPLIDDDSGQVVLGRSRSVHRKWGLEGTLFIGAVGERQGVGDDLFGRKLTVDAIFPHIIFICGTRGSGTS